MKIDKRDFFSGIALLGMCIGGTVVASMLEADSDLEKESQEKQATEIAKACVLLANKLTEEIEKCKNKI